MTRDRDVNRKASAEELAARAAAALREVAGVTGAGDSRRDGLTGLYDDRTLHRGLTDAISDAGRDGGHVGLLFIDLDRFKNVNDRHGHVTGSRVLSQVAGFADAAASRERGFAARYGGDEFVVVLPGADLDRCLREAERLRATLAATIFAGGEPPGRRPLVRVTCSIGAASMRADAGGDHDETPGPQGAATRLLQLADNAMYQAKHAGRNRVAADDAEATGAA
ncbi:MAG: GGDEF domain-containing protein [Acidobacteriota bacterium]|nr:GGDEF domain-containing protein [Acidobacteriota bacterium]